MGRTRKSHYAIARGRGAPLIVTEWSECQDRCYGFKGCKFKGFYSLAAAEGWLREQAIDVKIPAPMPDKVRPGFRDLQIGDQMKIMSELGWI